MNCLIVDDEPISQEVIEDYISMCPELTLIGKCNNAIDAGEKLKNENIDLLFLDINMPRLTGIGWIKSLKNPPLFILVTAYPEFAVEGFEVDAVDYLVKPVSFERFRIAVNRSVERFASSPEKEEVTHILVRANKKNYRLAFDDLLYLEAQGDYVRFVTSELSLMVHGTMKDFLKHLPSENFLRIHKSYVISISKVVYVEGNQVKLGEQKIPVSINYKDELLKRLA
jgi:DNA-binding LytR/AlgR family response regulator